MNRTVLKACVENVRLERPQLYKNICVFPILNGSDVAPDYLSLTEAMEKDLLVVTEVSESGSVPTLQAANKGDLPILIVDGEELQGAKQNRIINTSILLEPHTETVIPVSCTERGRWGYRQTRSRTFMDSGVVMSSKARARKSERLYNSLKAKEGYRAEQSEVWKDIDAFQSKSAFFSHTSAMRDVFESKRTSIEEHLEAFPLLPSQKGLVVFINGRLSALDVVSRHSAYQHLHQKLLKSHIVEAISEDTEADTALALEVNAQSFLQKMPGLSMTEHQPVGLGTDLRLEEEAAAGAALVYKDQVVHLNGFLKDKSDG